MAKKETTKPKKDSELDDSIPLRVSHGERADMGVARGIRACRDDKPESPGRKRVLKEEEFEVLENKLDFGFTLNNASYRSPDVATAARLKKMVERMEAKKKKDDGIKGNKESIYNIKLRQ